MNRTWNALVPNFLFLFVLISCESQQQRQEKYPNGNLKEKFSVIETENGSFQKHGEYKSWYSNGSIKLQGSNSKGKKIGRWQAWYENGQKESETNFKDDVPVGAFVSYFQNGNKRSEGSFSNGKEIGLWSFWSSNGTLTNRTNYNNESQLHGLQQSWDDNGNKLFEENFSNGLREGFCRQWNLEGKLFVNATFKNGSLDGLPTTFKTQKGEILELLSPTNYRMKFLSNMDNYYKWEWKNISGNYSFKQNDIGSLLINFGNDYLNELRVYKITNDTIQSERFIFIRQ